MALGSTSLRPTGPVPDRNQIQVRRHVTQQTQESNSREAVSYGDFTKNKIWIVHGALKVEKMADAHLFPLRGTTTSFIKKDRCNLLAPLICFILPTSADRKYTVQHFLADLWLCSVHCCSRDEQHRPNQHEMPLQRHNDNPLRIMFSSNPA